MKRKIMFTVALILTLTLCISAYGCGSTPAAAEPEPTPEPVVKTYESEKTAAESAMSSGDHDAAIESYEFMIAEEPASEEAMRGLASAYEAKGDAAKLIECYETLQKMDVFTSADYVKLAGLYADAGETEKEWRLLQIATLLAPDDAYEPLMDAVVIDATRSEELSETFAALFDAVSGSNTAAALDILCSDEWKTGTEQLLGGGCKYAYAADGSTLKVLTGYSGEERDDRVWLVGEGGSVTFLRVKADSLVSVTSDYKNDAYEGAFISERLNFDNGVYFKDAGTFAAGLCDGDFTSEIVWDDDEEDADLKAMYERKSASEDASEYTGSFEAGKAKAASQSGVKGVIYAYASGNKDYIYATLGEDESAGDYVFDCEVFGLELPPEW